MIGLSQWEICKGTNIYYPPAPKNYHTKLYKKMQNGFACLKLYWQINSLYKYKFQFLMSEKKNPKTRIRSVKWTVFPITPLFN